MKASYSFCHMNIVLPKHTVYIGTHNTDFTNMSDVHPMALLHKKHAALSHTENELQQCQCTNSSTWLFHVGTVESRQQSSLNLQRATTIQHHGAPVSEEHPCWNSSNKSNSHDATATSGRDGAKSWLLLLIMSSDEPESRLSCLLAALDTLGRHCLDIFTSSLASSPPT